MAIAIEFGFKSHAVIERSGGAADVICQMGDWLKRLNRNTLLHGR